MKELHNSANRISAWRMRHEGANSANKISAWRMRHEGANLANKIMRHDGAKTISV